MMNEMAVLLYGDGAELGSFKLFAEHLKKNLEKKYSKIIIKYINRDYDFVIFLLSTKSDKERISELHIFAHSIGAGLFFGYKDSFIANKRNQVAMAARSSARRVGYMEAVKTVIGAVQTDDLLVNDIFTTKKDELRSLFTPNAFIKIWGCNSGIANWTYSDYNVIDQSDTSVLYYWRAFNTLNTPKKSIAQAMANFFKVKVYGASSGASIQVLTHKKWISSQAYKQQVGHWPSGKLPHRLVPDKGGYSGFISE